MYTVVHSSDPPAMVLLFAGLDTTDDEYEAVVRAWERLYRDANGRSAVGLVVVPKHHAQPNARWRRRFAEVHEKAVGPMHVGIVTDSAIIRGVVTAINWLTRSRSRPNYSSSAFDTVEAAAQMFGSIDGMAPATLRALFVKAQEQMREYHGVSSTTGTLRL